MPRRKQNNKKKKNNQRQSSTSSATTTTTTTSCGMMMTAASTVVTPLSEPLFVVANEIYYYPRVQLSSTSTSTSTIMITVGDIVAIARNESRITNSYEKNFFLGHPKWSPAQVLALYQQHQRNHNHNKKQQQQQQCWYMTIRWFYRQSEFTDESVLFALEEHKQRQQQQQEELTNHHSDDDDVVYEHTRIDEVRLDDVSSVLLGRVNLSVGAGQNPSTTSFVYNNNNNNKTTTAATTTTAVQDGLAEITMTCSGTCRIIATTNNKNNDDVVVVQRDHVDDDEEARRRRQLQRGLACLNDRDLEEATRLGMRELLQRRRQVPPAATAETSNDNEEEEEVDESSEESSMEERRRRHRSDDDDDEESTVEQEEVLLLSQEQDEMRIRMSGSSSSSSDDESEEDDDEPADVSSFVAESPSRRPVVGTTTMQEPRDDDDDQDESREERQSKNVHDSDEASDRAILEEETDDDDDDNSSSLAAANHDDASAESSLHNNVEQESADEHSDIVPMNNNHDDDDDSSSTEEEDDDNRWDDTESLDIDVVDEEMTANSQILNHSCPSTERTYYQSIQVPFRPEVCAPHVVPSKRNKERWTVGVGDVICLQSCSRDDAPPRDDHVLSKHKKRSPKEAKLWYPFIVPWVVCQILSIYQDTSDEGGVKLEVRWYYRTSALPKYIRERMLYDDSESEMEEVFETDNVETGLRASRILGHVDLFFAGRDTKAGKSRQDSVPKVECRCSYFFVTHDGTFQLQPLYCSATSPEAWYTHAVCRGVSLSKNVRTDGALRKEVEALVGKGDGTLYSELLDQDDKEEPRQLEPAYGNVASLQVRPPWDSYCLSDTFWNQEDRAGLTWRVCVGDLVAIEDAEAYPPNFQRGARMWYPFTTSWSPAQVVAIVDVNGEDHQLEIRWLKRFTDPSVFGKHKTVQNSAEKLKVDAFYETLGDETLMIDLESVLGPLTVLSHSSDDEDAAPLRFNKRYLPQALFIYAGTFDSETRKARLANWSWREVVSRGIDCSSVYEDDTARLCMKRFLGVVENDADQRSPFQEKAEPRKRARIMDQDDEEHFPIDNDSLLDTVDPDTIQVWTTIPPFHTDVASKRAYYSEMHISPPYEHYVFGRSHVECDEPGVSWRVKMGDSVILQYEVGAGKARYEAALQNHSAHHPFKVPWAVGEIVSIWKQFEEREDLLHLDTTYGDPVPRHEDNIMIEVRWYYRHDELLTGSRSQRKNPVVSVALEEVFESDHVENDLEAATILAPAKVHSSQAWRGAPETFLGMPVVQVYCGRFWSLHRKSIVPCGDSSGRVERGRMLSRYFGKDRVLRASFDQHMRPGVVEAMTDPALSSSDYEGAPVWRRPFLEVIKRLSLTDAADETANRGDKLPGREKEMEKIASFLRNAICGQTATDDFELDDAGSPKCSMFVAGPPGTGKTASVRSIMAQLRYEQARGDLPAFDFVSLNGMELRHPFEAYVRLWEELSGGARERKPPEVAVAKLEKYFTNDRGHDGHNGDQRIIVVLLDEIDYLFTKKQTVLYSFFDWPIRASERTNGPRLIVVGISNTMHLPSLLKPSVQSRLGKHRCYFKAYKTEDIVTILKDKVKHGSYEVFDEGAIMFAARKTSSMSGDLRKALQICKAAAESVLKDSEEGKWVDPQGKATSPIVRVKNVHRAGQESFGSILNKAVALTSPFEVLVLISLGSLSKTTGRQIGGFDIDELLTKIESIAKASGERMYLPPPTFGETLEILNRLGESRLVSLSTPKSSSVSFRAAQGGSGGAWPLISLPMESSSIMIALRDTPHQALADKYLGHQGFF